MSRNYKPKVKVWTEASVEKALHEVGVLKKSVNSTAKKYHLSTSFLVHKYQENECSTKMSYHLFPNS